MALLTGCYRPAINTFIEARKQRIDELNAAYGLGPGHNRATARTQPNAIPELVKKFKEERAAVLKAKTTFIGMEKLLSLSRATCYHLRLSFETEKPNEGYQPAGPTHPSL